VTSPAVPSGPPRLTIRDRVAWITLERPETHNALNAGDTERFRAHLAAVDADEHVRVLVVTGSGDATFCSGASLRDIESGAMTGETFEALADALAAVRVPSICALNGDAFGGGTELALCCDFRIGVFGSRMAVPAARLGICYPLGGLRRYVEALGLGVASRLLLASEELDAEEMTRAGFLHRLVSQKDLEPAADEMATHLAALAPLAVQAMKRILRGVARRTVDEEEARALIVHCAGSEDLQEGLRARRQGRDPEFRGR
jgi:enoyl-CoA hydratase/carnithine racemase